MVMVGDKVYYRWIVGHRDASRQPITAEAHGTVLGFVGETKVKVRFEKNGRPVIVTVPKDKVSPANDAIP